MSLELRGCWSFSFVKVRILKVLLKVEFMIYAREKDIFLLFLKLSWFNIFTAEYISLREIRGLGLELLGIHLSCRRMLKSSMLLRKYT